MPYSHQVFLFHGHVWEIILCPSAGHARSTIPSGHGGDFGSFLELLTPQCPQSKRQFPRKQVLLYPFMTSSSLILCYDVILQQSDWLKRAQSCHLVGTSLFSPAFQYRKVNFASDSEEGGCAFWLSFGLNVSDSPDWSLLASPQDMSSSMN